MERREGGLAINLLLSASRLLELAITLDVFVGSLVAPYANGRVIGARD